MKKLLRDAFDDAMNDVRESDRKRMNEFFIDGYNEAANICVGILTKKIDDLFSKIDSDSYLSKQEQFMLSKLKELKSETEDELRDFWSNNE
jgi:hypothetical protein